MSESNNPFLTDTRLPFVAILGARNGYVQLAASRPQEKYQHLNGQLLRVALDWARRAEVEGAERIYWITLSEMVRHLHIHLYPRWATDEVRGLPLFEARNDDPQPPWSPSLIKQLHQWARKHDVHLINPAMLTPPVIQRSEPATVAVAQVVDTPNISSQMTDTPLVVETATLASALQQDSPEIAPAEPEPSLPSPTEPEPSLPLPAEPVPASPQPLEPTPELLPPAAVKEPFAWVEPLTLGALKVDPPRQQEQPPSLTPIESEPSLPAPAEPMPSSPEPAPLSSPEPETPLQSPEPQPVSPPVEAIALDEAPPVTTSLEALVFNPSHLAEPMVNAAIEPSALTPTVVESTPTQVALAVETLLLETDMPSVVAVDRVVTRYDEAPVVRTTLEASELQAPAAMSEADALQCAAALMSSEPAIAVTLDVTAQASIDPIAAAPTPVSSSTSTRATSVVNGTARDTNPTLQEPDRHSAHYVVSPPVMPIALSAHWQARPKAAQSAYGHAPISYPVWMINHWRHVTLMTQQNEPSLPAMAQTL